jgi:hypothetical protein
MNEWFRDGIKFDNDKITIIFNLKNLKAKARTNREDFERDYLSAIEYLPEHFKDFLKQITGKMREKGFFKTESIIRNYSSDWKILLDLVTIAEFDEIMSTMAENQNQRSTFISLMGHERFDAHRIRIKTEFLVNILSKDLRDGELVEKIMKLVKEDQKEEMHDNLKAQILVELRKLVDGIIKDRFGYGYFEYDLKRMIEIMQIWKTWIIDDDRKFISDLIVTNLVKKLKTHMRHLRQNDGTMDSSRYSKYFRIFESLFGIVETDNDDWQTMKATFALLKINRGGNQ